VSLIHKGVRPVYPIEMLDFKRKIWLEECPDGRIKLWNSKMLTSGCNNELDIPVRELEGCIYCPWCDEYFSYDQWEDSDGEG
jgi:hypothetical protein